jgi:phospholipid transport system substrate-binding protein
MLPTGTAMTKSMAAWLLMVAAAAAPAGNPRDVVQAAVSRALTVLEEAQVTRSESQQAARTAVERIRPELRRVAAELFDFDEMARRTLSRHWAGRSAKERAEFVTLFTDLLERSYLGRIEGYAGEKIAYLGESVDDDYAVVRSRVLRRPRDIALDYRLHLRNGRWKVYDVLVDGVSWVSTYRSQFDRVILTSSWDELVDRLRKKQSEFRAVGAERS